MCSDLAALENEDEEFAKVLQNIKTCGCCPTCVGCCAGVFLAWLLTSLLMLIYINGQPSINPGAAGDL